MSIDAPLRGGASAAASAPSSDGKRALRHFPEPPLPRLLVISWNVWVGRGRLLRLVERVRAGAFAALAAYADAPLVILLQEAFRADPSVPGASNGAGPRDRPRDTGAREDVVDVARELGLHLRYAPSMRNASAAAERGAAPPSDRGNAILTSLPILRASAAELPFVIQRRVAITASVLLDASTEREAAPAQPQPDLAPAHGSRRRTLTVVSAHLDPLG
ncbi:MAG: hypothetical protein H0V09_02235, partial [Gemmatimonadetes bacterium]|nr:hypothetical protein [Gemmatimonadota bacterium]